MATAEWSGFLRASELGEYLLEWQKDSVTESVQDLHTGPKFSSTASCTESSQTPQLVHQQRSDCKCLPCYDQAQRFYIRYNAASCYQAKRARQTSNGGAARAAGVIAVIAPPSGSALESASASRTHIDVAQSNLPDADKCASKQSGYTSQLQHHVRMLQGALPVCDGIQTTALREEWLLHLSRDVFGVLPTCTTGFTDIVSALLWTILHHGVSSLLVTHRARCSSASAPPGDQPTSSMSETDSGDHYHGANGAGDQLCATGPSLINHPVEADSSPPFCCCQHCWSDQDVLFAQRALPLVSAVVRELYELLHSRRKEAIRYIRKHYRAGDPPSVIWAALFDDSKHALSHPFNVVQSATCDVCTIDSFWLKLLSSGQSSSVKESSCEQNATVSPSGADDVTLAPDRSFLGGVAHRYFCSYRDLAFQELLMLEVLQDPLRVQFPPPPSYVYQVLHPYIKQLESANLEIYEPLLLVYDRALKHVHAGANANADGDGQDSLPARVFELRPDTRRASMAADSPTALVPLRMNADIFNNVGLTGWPAGYLLAEVLLHRQEMVAGHRVLELGSGIGITAIVAALCRPHAVVATDYESHVMQLLCENISLNSSPASHHLAQHHTNERLVRDLMADRKCGNCGAVVDIRAQQLDWTCPDDLDQIARFKPSVILAADTIYLPELVPALVKVMATCLSDRDDRMLCDDAPPCSPPSTDSPCVYVAQSVRNPDTYQGFLLELQRSGLEYAQCEFKHVPQIFWYNRQGLQLLQVTAASVSK